jgi:hypothetical protein
MDNERYKMVDMGYDTLSKEEKSRGWHFCPDWDYMTVGPGMSELEGCTCNVTKKRSSKEVEAISK